MIDKEDLKNLLIGAVTSIIANIVLEEIGFEEWLRQKVQEVMKNGRTSRKL